MSDFSLPPTINTLGRRQRARLLQSSRKLGAILGTTPQFVEVFEPVSRSSSLRTDAKLFTHPDTSVSSLDEPTPTPRPARRRGLTLTLKLVAGSVKAPVKTPKNACAPLVLHYQIPRGHDHRDSIASVVSAESEVHAAGTRSPLSPRQSNATDFRRRRMAKLKATLGENVPPELVFPVEAVSAAEERRQLRAQRGRSWSVGSPTAPPVERKPSVKAPSFERNRVDSLAFYDYTDRSVSRAETIDYVSRDKSLERSISPESFLSVESIGTRRKEKGWSGEWNQNDMNNVIKSLRDLKAK